MSFMEETIEKVLPIWNACKESRFIREMKSGSLPMEKFKFYMIQDSIYLKNYARIYGLAIFQATCLKDIQFYYSILCFVTESESALRLNYLKQFGMNDDDIEHISPARENQQYIDFMLDIAKQGDNRKILMALLPCMLSYTYIFHSIADEADTQQSPYWDFIQDYSDEGILKEYKAWCDYADACFADCDNDEKAELQLIFKKASLLELNFWEMAYHAKVQS